MIRMLQRRFIFTAMIAISVLLTVLLGAINIFNTWATVEQNERMLTSVARELSDPFGLTVPPLKPSFSDFLDIHGDARRSAAYFVVYTDNYGNILAADVTNIRTMTQEDAKEIAEAITKGETERGKAGSYRFTCVKTVSGYARAYVFLDIYSASRNVVVVLILSAVAGVCCWIFMLLLVIALSRKAIRPIAENMEKQKQFVTDAGHEIKTPLAIILANTEAMELHTGENKWITNIKEQTHRLDMLTKNMLTLAKIDGGEIRLNEEQVDVSLCVRKAEDMFTEPARLKNIGLACSICEGITFRGETEYIFRIISILMDNAVKYTSPGGKIELNLSKAGKGFELTVANTFNEGEIDTERLFDRFYRRDSSRTQKNGGYGIGLSAARAITENYGGSISAKTEENRIVFTVKMP